MSRWGRGGGVPTGSEGMYVDGDKESWAGKILDVTNDAKSDKGVNVFWRLITYCIFDIQVYDLDDANYSRNLP